MEDVELISAREAARRLGFGTEHILDLCRRGEIPSAKVGSRWRIIWPLALRKILAEGGVTDETNIK